AAPGRPCDASSTRSRLPDVTLPDGFDLDALLAPIRGDTPQGTDVREDYSAQSPYRRLQDIRSEVRDAERQAESPDPDGPPPPRDRAAMASDPGDWPEASDRNDQGYRGGVLAGGSVPAQPWAERACRMQPADCRSDGTILGRLVPFAR